MTAAHRTDNKHFLHQWIIHAMVLLALGGFIAYTQYQEYHRIGRQEYERLTNQAEIVAKNLAPQLQLANRVIDSVLKELPAWREKENGMQHANRQLKVINDALIGIRPILLAGADGKVNASSDPRLLGTDLSRTAHFQSALRHAAAAHSHLSVQDAPRGQAHAISLSRRLLDARGELAGFVMVSLVPEYLTGMLDSARYAPDVWSAVSGAEGRPYMVSPPGAGAPEGRHMVAVRIVAPQAGLADAELQVRVARDTDALFEPWRRSVYVQSFLFGAIAIISTLGLLTIQKRHRIQHAERRKAEKKIQELAFFDQLTRLPNRILLLDRLKQAMKASQRNGSHGAVLFIDLDNFKTLNDTLGHDMGDLLLQQVAQRLNNCVRASDTVARLGGDEFVIMLTDLHAHPEDATIQVETVGSKILQELSQTYQLNQVTHRSTSSIGATLFLGVQTSIDDLLKQADLAMYKSKAVGRNALRFFDPAMEVIMLERSSLETDLRDAISCGQLLLHYQPQINAMGEMTGVEALVRWQHPVRGLVPPASFIPLAEEIGIILPLGQWVLETACRQLVAWESRPAMRQLSIAVNVSSRQFSEDDFVEQVLAALAASGASPHRLKLELTESLLVSDVNGVIEKMSALKAYGVGFSLDDFGTGYSSLAYLKRLPLDQLKIDQSFVRDVLNDQSDASIAKTIIALAKSLDIDVIAEGVETGAQRDFLAHAGCHAYQGYFFSRPLTLSDLEYFALRSAAPAPAPALTV